MATEQATARNPIAGITGAFRSLRSFFKRNLTRKSGAAVIIWRIEARFATPVALVLVATLGRWNGALAMGAIMAAYSAIFLFLLDGERVIDEMRSWVRQQGWGHRLLHVAERPDRKGVIQRLLWVPVIIMTFGPFWRAITLHLARAPRIPAYVISVGGSFPHSLFWTGVVLGGLYEAVLKPLWGSLF